MKKNDFGLILAFVAGIIITYLLIDNMTKKNKIKELQDRINENENLNKEIRTQLTELIQNNEDIDPKIANELAQIVALLEIKQDTTAVLKLTKIIENLLKELYKGDLELKEVAKTNGRKVPVLADYLEYAMNKKVISTEDYHLLSVLKIIRNEEAHELSVHKEKTKIFAAFVAGLGIVMGLCKLLKKKTLDTNKTE